MIKEMGFCRGIENYSRHLTGKNPGEPPPTTARLPAARHHRVLDESHQTVPQARGMFEGDQSRKRTLVENTASACRRRSIIDRSTFASSKRASARRFMCPLLRDLTN